jgi:hypothetical protein
MAFQRLTCAQLADFFNKQTMMGRGQYEVEACVLYAVYQDSLVVLPFDQSVDDEKRIVFVGVGDP